MSNPNLPEPQATLNIQCATQALTLHVDSLYLPGAQNVKLAFQDGTLKMTLPRALFPGITFNPDDMLVCYLSFTRIAMNPPPPASPILLPRGH